MSEVIADGIGITLIPQAAGGWVCEATVSLAEREVPTKRFHGQTSNHAIAIALEDLARLFRAEAEAEQNGDWDAVQRSAFDEVVDRRFHVILHYECVAEEQSRFEALNNTLLGNTVIEGADIAIIEVDADVPMPEWKRRRDT